MKTTLLIKLLLIALVAQKSNCFFGDLFRDSISRAFYSSSASLDGKCYFRGRSFSCRVYIRSRSNIISISGSSSAFSGTVFNGNRIPLAYVSSISTKKKSRTFRKTKYYYKMYIRSPRYSGYFEVKEEKYWLKKNSTFVNVVQANSKYFRNKARTGARNLLNAIGTYNSKKSIVDRGRSEYNNSANRINALNQYIYNNSVQINRISSQLTQREAASSRLSSSSDQILRLANQSNSNVTKCEAESVALGELISTYEKYSEEFTDDKKFEFLDQEQQNLCKFHIASEDIGVILPSMHKKLYTVRKEVTDQLSVEGVDRLFADDDFFIYQE